MTNIHEEEFTSFQQQALEAVTHYRVNGLRSREMTAVDVAFILRSYPVTEIKTALDDLVTHGMVTTHRLNSIPRYYIS